MKFYYHPRLEQIKDCPKYGESNFAIGPFETLQDAEEWVSNHKTIFIPIQATDVRIKMQPRTKVKES